MMNVWQNAVVKNAGAAINMCLVMVHNLWFKKKFKKLSQFTIFIAENFGEKHTCRSCRSFGPLKRYADFSQDNRFMLNKVYCIPCFSHGLMSSNLDKGRSSLFLLIYISNLISCAKCKLNFDRHFNGQCVIHESNAYCKNCAKRYFNIRIAGEW